MTAPISAPTDLSASSTASIPLRPAVVRIDLAALRHNLALVRAAVQIPPNPPFSKEGIKIFAVVKADAYGHGMLPCALVMQPDCEGFVVSTLGEAEALRKGGITKRIMVLQGFSSAIEARFAARLLLEPVVHQAWQVELIEKTHLGLPLKVWLKVNSGMHRVGVAADDVQSLHARLMASGRLRGAPGLMTHFARADECATEEDALSTQRQLDVFEAATLGLEGERSVANSAGIFGSAAQGRLGDIVRPGIALYGSNPLVHGSAASLGLKAVMQFETRLLALKAHRQGDAVGYGGRFVCPEDMPVGVASVGYADGYPRVTAGGTPVGVHGQVARLAGRVSMDLLTLDMRGVDAKVGDTLQLWGADIAVDTVAQAAGTLGYELLCAAGRAGRRVYEDILSTETTGSRTEIGDMDLREDNKLDLRAI